MSALQTISVLAVGMSRPDSTMRRRQQHVVFSLIEGGHDVFELPGRHLAVADSDLRLGRIFLQEGLRLADILDARARQRKLWPPR